MKPNSPYTRSLTCSDDEPSSTPLGWVKISSLHLSRMRDPGWSRNRRSHASSASLASHDRDALGGVDFAASIRAAMASAAWKREGQPWEARKRALKPACPGGNGGFGAHLSSRQPSREPLEPPRVMDRAPRTSRGTSRPPSRHASPEGTRPNGMRSSWSKSGQVGDRVTGDFVFRIFSSNEQIV